MAFRRYMHLFEYLDVYSSQIPRFLIQKCQARYGVREEEPCSLDRNDKGHENTPACFIKIPTSDMAAGRRAHKPMGIS